MMQLGYPLIVERKPGIILYDPRSPIILLNNLTILITGFKYQFRYKEKTIKKNLSIYQKNYIIYKKIKISLFFLWI